ncbi:MAG: 1-acyl-sn-glycerol-3-phosphate acyltransferase [Thermodesulfobacteriota bacterium]
MKLYPIIVRLLRVFSRLYFVERRALYAERVPGSGPVILAANHPTSVLDAILLAMQSRRQIHFLAKSGLFRNRLIGAFLRRVGAIPVYRPQEVEAHGRRNVEVFEKVYELFERGGCLGLFPEGRNSPGGQVEDDQTTNLANDLSEALGYRLDPLSLQEQTGHAAKSASRFKRLLWKLLDWYRPDASDNPADLGTRTQDRKNLAAILETAMARDPSAVSALRRQLDRFFDHLHQTESSQTIRESLRAPLRERLIRLRMTL